VVTRGELLTALEPDEVDYARLVRYFGSDVLPLLPELITGVRPDIAAKATSLAGLIEGPDRVTVLELASRSPHDVVRVAAASAAGSVSSAEAERLVPDLLEDEDASVRKLAIRAAGPVANHSRVQEALERIRREDPIDALRASAGDVHHRDS
jgi:HEAT repeat protein